MKKQIFRYGLVVLMAVAVFGGVQVPQVEAIACSLMSAGVSPSSGYMGQTVTISWYAQACDHVVIQLNPNSGSPYSVTGTGGGSGSYSKVLSGPPETYTITAMGICPKAGETEEEQNTVKACGSRSVSVAAATPPQPATVSISTGSCPANSTFSGTFSGTGSQTLTFTPATGGTTVSLAGAVPANSGYTYGGMSPSSQVVFPGDSDSFTMNCTQLDPVPTVIIKANGSDGPISVNAGSSVTVSWTSTNADSCSSPWGTPSGSQPYSPTVTTTYSITCTSATGLTATDSVTVNVTGSATVSVSASSNPITSGQSSTLTWSSTNASSCSAWWAPNTNTSGSVSVSPSVTTTYSMTCTGNTGFSDGTGGTTITVNQPTGNPPVVTISASPTSGLAGTVAPQLTWSVTNSPTSCTASASPANTNWSGAKASASSGVSVGTLNTVGNHGFTLVCSNNAGSGSGTAYVAVEPSTGIRVFSNLSGGSWTVSGPTPFSGSGTGGAWVAVTPGTYSLSAGSVANYTSSVTGTDNTGNTLVIATGNRKDFNISYTPIGGDSWDYSLTNTGPVTTTQGGGLYNVVVNRNVVSGTQEAVTLAVSGLPTGVTVSGTTNATATAPQSSTITFNVSSSAQVGTHSVTVTGTTGDGITRTTTVSLVVNPANSLSVSCRATPSPAEVGKQVVWTADPLGGDGNYTYSWIGTNFPAPAPSERTYAIIYQTTGSKTAQVTVRDAGGAGTTVQCATAQLQVNAKIKPQEF